MSQTRERQKKEKKIKFIGGVKSLTMGPICNFNYKNAIENRVMGTENSQNVFLVFITHYSKIRELNDENKNWKQSYENPNNLFSHGSHNF